MMRPKRAHRISPNDKTESDKDILDRYKLKLPREVCILDASKLPPPHSPEYVELLGRHDVQQLFSNSVINSIAKMDDALDSMLADCWEAFKPFIPDKIFRMMFKRSTAKATSGEGTPFFKISEMTVIASILNGSIPTRRDCPFQEKVLKIAESLTLPIKIMLARLKGLTLIKKEVQHFYRRFVTRYPKSLSPALGLLKDFNTSRCHVLQTSSSPFNRKAINSVYFCFHRVGYSILCNSTTDETGLAWKGSGEISDKLQTIIAEGIGNEAEDRISTVLALLKGSLNRIHQVMQSSSGEDHICLSLELVRLKKLFKFQKFSLAKSSSATILFSFMRILSKLNLLEKILIKCSKELQVAQKKLYWNKTFFYKLSPKFYDAKKRPVVLHLRTYTNWGKEAIAITTNDFKESRLPSLERGDEVDEGQDRVSSGSDKILHLESGQDDAEFTDD